MGFFRDKNWEERVEEKLNRLTFLLQTLGEIKMTLDELKAVADAQTAVINAAKALLEQLAAGADPTKVQAVADVLAANTATLEAAIAAATPPPPTP